MAILFFDTSSIKLKYLSVGKSEFIRRVVANRKNTVHISEMTVLEFSGALASHCRGKGLDAKFFDKCVKGFFRDIASGRLLVDEFCKDDLLRATDLLKYVGVHKRRNLGSADALIATCCQELAYKKQTKVKFYSSDRKFCDILKSTDSFNSTLEIIYIDPQ